MKTEEAQEKVAKSTKCREKGAKNGRGWKGDEKMMKPADCTAAMSDDGERVSLKTHTCAADMSVERKQHRMVSLTIVSCLGTAPAGDPSAKPRPIANEAEMKES